MCLRCSIPTLRRCLGDRQNCVVNMNYSYSSAWMKYVLYTQHTEACFITAVIQFSYHRQWKTKQNIIYISTRKKNRRKKKQMWRRIAVVCVVWIYYHFSIRYYAHTSHVFDVCTQYDSYIYIYSIRWGSCNFSLHARMALLPIARHCCLCTTPHIHIHHHHGAICTILAVLNS